MRKNWLNYSKNSFFLYHCSYFLFSLSVEANSVALSSRFVSLEKSSNF